MKTMSSNSFSPLTAQILKLVGVLLIFVFLLNLVTLLFPFQPLDRTWQISLATQMVEPGVILLVGLALIFVAYWISNSAGNTSVSRKAWLDLRFWAIFFSSLLGLLFLVLFPLHLSNISQASNQAVEQINQKAANDKTTLENQLNSPQAQLELQQQQAQLKAQIDELLKNEQQYNQVLQSNTVPQQLKDLLKESKANPKNIDQLVQQKLQDRLGTLRTTTLNQIQSRQAEAQRQAQQEAWRSSLRVGGTCLLLAIGYIAMSWMGLKSMGWLLPARR